jgi:hypothetical protein
MGQASDFQVHDGRATPTFVLGRLSYTRNLRMLNEILAKSLAKDAHPAAVDNAHSREPGKEGAIKKFFHLGCSFVYILPDDVDLGRRVIVFISKIDADAPGARGLHGIRFRTPQYLRNVIERNLHFHGADLNFQRLTIEFPDDSPRASERLELHGIAFTHALHDVRARVLIAFVGSGRMRYNRLIELLTELATRFCDATFSFLAEFERCGAILNRTYGFARVIFEIAKQRIEFLFKFAELVFLFLETFLLKTLLFAREFLFADAHLLAIVLYHA